MTSNRPPHEVTQVIGIFDSDEFDVSPHERLHMAENAIKGTSLSVKEALGAYALSEADPLGVLIGDAREEIEAITAVTSDLSLAEIEADFGFITTKEELLTVATYMTSRDDLRAEEKQRRLEILYGAARAYLDFDIEADEFSTEITSRSSDPPKWQDLPPLVRANEIKSSVMFSAAGASADVERLLAIDPEFSGSLSGEHEPTVEGESATTRGPSPNVDSGPTALSESGAASEPASDATDSDRHRSSSEQSPVDGGGTEGSVSAASQDNASGTSSGDMDQDPLDLFEQRGDVEGKESSETGVQDGDDDEDADIPEKRDHQPEIPEEGWTEEFTVDPGNASYWGCPICSSTQEELASIGAHLTATGGDHEGESKYGRTYHIPGYVDDGRLTLTQPRSEDAEFGTVVPADLVTPDHWATEDQKEAARADQPLETCHWSQTDDEEELEVEPDESDEEEEGWDESVTINPEVVAYWGCPLCSSTNEDLNSITAHLNASGGAHKGEGKTNRSYHLPGYTEEGVLEYAQPRTEDADLGTIVPANMVAPDHWASENQRKAADDAVNVPIETEHSDGVIDQMPDSEKIVNSVVPRDELATADGDESTAPAEPPETESVQSAESDAARIDSRHRDDSTGSGATAQSAEVEIPIRSPGASASPTEQDSPTGDESPLSSSPDDGEDHQEQDLGQDQDQDPDQDQGSASPNAGSPETDGLSSDPDNSDTPASQRQDPKSDTPTKPGESDGSTATEDGIVSDRPVAEGGDTPSSGTAEKTTDCQVRETDSEVPEANAESGGESDIEAENTSSEDITEDEPSSSAEGTVSEPDPILPDESILPDEPRPEAASSADGEDASEEISSPAASDDSTQGNGTADREDKSESLVDEGDSSQEGEDDDFTSQQSTSGRKRSPQIEQTGAEGHETSSGTSAESDSEASPQETEVAAPSSSRAAPVTDIDEDGAADPGSEPDLPNQDGRVSTGSDGENHTDHDREGPTDGDGGGQPDRVGESQTDRVDEQVGGEQEEEEEHALSPDQHAHDISSTADASSGAGGSRSGEETRATNADTPSDPSRPSTRAGERSATDRDDDESQSAGGRSFLGQVKKVLSPFRSQGQRDDEHGGTDSTSEQQTGQGSQGEAEEPLGPPASTVPEDQPPTQTTQTKSVQPNDAHTAGSEAPSATTDTDSRPAESSAPSSTEADQDVSWQSVPAKQERSEEGGDHTQPPPADEDPGGIADRDRATVMGDEDSDDDVGPTDASQSSSQRKQGGVDTGSDGLAEQTPPNDTSSNRASADEEYEAISQDSDEQTFEDILFVAGMTTSVALTEAGIMVRPVDSREDLIDRVVAIDQLAGLPNQRKVELMLKLVKATPVSLSRAELKEVIAAHRQDSSPSPDEESEDRENEDDEAGSTADERLDSDDDADRRTETQDQHKPIEYQADAEPNVDESDDDGTDRPAVDASPMPEHEGASGTPNAEAAGADDDDVEGPTEKEGRDDDDDEAQQSAAGTGGPKGESTASEVGGETDTQSPPESGSPDRDSDTDDTEIGLPEGISITDGGWVETPVDTVTSPGTLADAAINIYTELNAPKERKVELIRGLAHATQQAEANIAPSGPEELLRWVDGCIDDDPHPVGDELPAIDREYNSREAVITTGVDIRRADVSQEAQVEAMQSLLRSAQDAGMAIDRTELANEIRQRLSTHESEP